MKLNELKPQKGATKRHKRLGHGPGSGRGKTSTRGHKGDRARSGYIVKRGYEGGQMPITRRIPKRGFVNIFRKHYEIVNVELLEKLDADTEVTPDYLKEKGYIKGGKMLKILGQGELSKPLFVKAHKFSKTAEEKILKAKGKIEKLL
ncbi:MAG: 50S ribosomal protein L15 [bacterium]